MEFIHYLPKRVVRILLVLAMIAIVVRVIIPRTSLYYMYWFYHPKFGTYLNTTDMVLVTGESFRLSVRTINQRLTFSSTDYKVAYVNNSGLVTANKPGIAFIKVKTRKKTLVCRVKVIALNHNTLTLKPGETKKLNVLGCWFLESYQSSDPSIARVSNHGKVTAIKSGTTTIKAKAKGRTLTCTITVP